MTDAWNEPCGFAALTRLQANLPRVYARPVKLHVFDEANRRITFVGTGKREARPLYLNLDEDHFELITSMTGWLGRNYFCTRCHKGYSDSKQHPCTRTCLRCKNKEGIDHYTPHDNARLQCSDCHHRSGILPAGPLTRISTTLPSVLADGRPVAGDAPSG